MRLILLLTLALLSQLLRAENMILVDTSRALLQVLNGNKIILELPDIAIGRGGASPQRSKGDAKTPLGRYHISEIRDSSTFYKYIGLDYPSISDAKAGFALGLIDKAKFDTITKAHRQGKMPPQNTTLGGYIGLHGTGKADPQVHAATNWTKGCIALTDEQIDRLLPLIRPGTTVEIR